MASSGRRRRPRRLLRWVALAALLLAAGLAAAVGWAMLRPGPNHPVELEVKPGTAAITVLDQLHRERLLPSPLLGRAYLTLRGGDRSLRFGVYRIPPRSTPVAVLERIASGRVEMVRLTVVEGADLATIASLAAANGIGDEQGWEEIGDRTDWLDEVVPQAPSLEGFLFPETYLFALRTPAAAAARHMVGSFVRVWEEERQQVDELWGSPLEVVTLASLVEGETSVAAERPLVAGVFLNRLRRGMILQADPTVVYALKRRNEWDGQLLRVHWAVDDPYNTYRYPGLPPGPINCPGRLALRAALAPAETDFLYFVATPSGGHTFSRTLAEHNRAVSRLLASRR